MDDLISRAAAISAVNTALFPKINTAKDAEEALKALPSAQPEKEREKCIFKPFKQFQPERKKGKWIEVDDYYNRISGRCSICGWEALMYETDVVGMDFCPNCGADMRKDGDGNV